MLQFGRHDVRVRTRPQVALDHEVQRVRGRGSEDHAGGIGYAEQPGQFLATRPGRIGGAAERPGSAGGLASAAATASSTAWGLGKVVAALFR